MCHCFCDISLSDNIICIMKWTIQTDLTELKKWKVPGLVVVAVVVAVVIVVWVVVFVVIVSETGEISLISHTLKPVDFSPGFATSINLQFSVGQSQDALQTRVPFSDVLPTSSEVTLIWNENLYLSTNRWC